MTPNELNSSRPPALKVVIRQPTGKYNRYEWDEGQQAIVLAERVWHAEQRLFEIASIPGTISQRGVELGVIIPCDQSDFPGAVVAVRVIGLASLTRSEAFPTQHYLIAIPLADSSYTSVKSVDELLPSWRAEVESHLTLSLFEGERDKGERNRAANSASEAYQQHQPGKISWQDEKEAWEVIGRARRAFRLTQVGARGPGQTGRSWQLSEEELDDYLQGNLYKEDETARHSQAENRLFQLPYRFQQHAARCLLPKERIITWIFRPAFKKGWLWRKQQENDALLILTDRQLLWLTDTLPPGSTMTDWGYQVACFPLNKLAGVKLTGLTGKAKGLEGKKQPGIEPDLNQNLPGELQLALTTLEGTTFQFNFNFGPQKSKVKSAPYSELRDLAFTLNEFVPDPARRKLLRLFLFEQSHLNDDNEGEEGGGSEEEKGTGGSKNSKKVERAKLKPQTRSETQVPATLRAWLGARKKKLILPPALTDYYKSRVAAMEEPGYVAIAVPVNQETEEKALFLSPASFETSNIDGPICFKKAEVVVSKGGKAGLPGMDPAAGVVTFPVSRLGGVEFTYSVLGCYLLFRTGIVSEHNYRTKEREMWWEPGKGQAEELKFTFFSPEVAQFQKLFLALRQLLDICL